MKGNLRRVSADREGRIVLFLADLDPGTELRIDIEDGSTYWVVTTRFVEIVTQGLVRGVLVSPSQQSFLVHDIVGRASFDTLAGDQIQVGRQWQINSGVTSRVTDIWTVE